MGHSLNAIFFFLNIIKKFGIKSIPNGARGTCHRKKKMESGFVRHLFLNLRLYREKLSNDRFKPETLYFIPDA